LDPRLDADGPAGVARLLEPTLNLDAAVRDGGIESKSSQPKQLPALDQITSNLRE
jgi:hypothetical protein